MTTKEVKEIKILFDNDTSVVYSIGQAIPIFKDEMMETTEIVIIRKMEKVI